MKIPDLKELSVQQLSNNELKENTGGIFGLGEVAVMVIMLAGLGGIFGGISGGILARATKK